MTKERLEELIKQGATIYLIDEGEIIEIGLADEIAEIYGDMLYYQDGIWWYIKDLFETKEQAEWHIKTYTARTERFEPPMWEDIKNTYGFRFVYYDDIIEFTVNYSTMLDGVEFNTQKIAIRNLDERELLFVEKATKKNYKKACEIVRNLFKGEK